MRLSNLKQSNRAVPELYQQKKIQARFSENLKRYTILTFNDTPELNYSVLHEGALL